MPQTSTDYFQDDDRKAGNFEVVVVVIQAILFTFMAYLLCRNIYRSLWHRLTLASLVLFEFSILVTGLGLFLGLKGDDPEDPKYVMTISYNLIAHFVRCLYALQVIYRFVIGLMWLLFGTQLLNYRVLIYGQNVARHIQGHTWIWAHSPSICAIGTNIRVRGDG